MLSIVFFEVAGLKYKLPYFLKSEKPMRMLLVSCGKIIKSGKHVNGTSVVKINRKRRNLFL
jgi:hypothetical protein